jgi:hypothetical protein
MREPTTVGVLICRHVSIDYCVKTYYYRSAAVAAGSTSPRMDIHAKDRYGWTALLGAAWGGQLLVGGADD